MPDLEYLFFLLWLLFFGLVPGILWILPKTRRRTGNWLVAWKTVPLGMIVFLLAVAALSRAGGIYWLRWLVAASCAATATFFLIRWARRRYHAEKPFRVWPSLLIAAGCFCCLFPLILLNLTLRTLLFQHGYRPPWEAIAIPADGPAQVAFEQRSIHPFLAEFDYRIAFTGKDGKQLCRLHTNGGGNTDFLVFKLDDGRLILSGNTGEYLVDGSKRKVCWLCRNNGKLLFFELPGGEAELDYSVSGKDDTFSVKFGGRPAKNVDPGDLGETMRLLGRIRFEFTPAKSEVKIPVSRLDENLSALVHRIE